MTEDNSEVSERRRLNVVLIFMDDMTHWAIGAIGGQIATPNLDRLVAKGTTFTHAFNQGSWTGAVCVASRAMLLTGQSLFRAKNSTESDGGCPVPLLAATIGQAGYRTFFTGKWHNPETLLRRSYHEVGPYDGAMLWPDPRPDGSIDVGRPSPGNTWDPTDPAGGGHWLNVDGRVVHSSEHWANSAISFLDSVERTPFFLHLAFHAPHDPRQAPKHWLDQYPSESVKVPPNFLPEHPFDQGGRTERDELLAPFPRTPEAIRLHRSEYFAIVSHADEQIGRVLDALDERGLAENTLVIFSGDHGLSLGEHGLMGKQNLYDHSVRVPLVLAGPGIPSGQRVDGLAYQSSIYPTLCELLGIPTPAHVEFPSLVPALAGDGSGQMSLLGVYRDLQRMVRTPRWSLIAYRVPGRVQLFDVAADPWQIDDLGARPGYAATVGDLMTELRRLQEEIGDTTGSWTAEIGSASRHDHGHPEAHRQPGEQQSPSPPGLDNSTSKAD